jgi:hypothetical protein
MTMGRKGRAGEKETMLSKNEKGEHKSGELGKKFLFTNSCVVFLQQFLGNGKVETVFIKRKGELVSCLFNYNTNALVLHP